MKYDRTIIGYHGCDATTAEALLAGKTVFSPSQNNYDWLGKGIYFWEYGVDRALRFAEQQRERGRLAEPAVIGAVIQLGNCFDLMDTKCTSALGSAFVAFSTAEGVEAGALPVNSAGLHKLDCAVLNFYLEAMAEEGVTYDTVRGAFPEGNPVFPGSAIVQESHIQLVVRNPACIVGVFRPML